MKKMWMVLGLIAAEVAFAQQPVAPANETAKKKWTPEQLKARDERVMKKTGGLIDVPPAGPAIVIVDARAKTGIGPQRVVDVYGNAAKQNISTEKRARGDQSAFAFGAGILKEKTALMVIVVTDDGATLPAWSVYPEERIAVVNADRLAEGVDDEGKEIRVIKEIWRSIGMLGGAGYSTMDNCVMQPVFSLQELDANKFQVMQPMNYPKMYKMFKKFDVKRGRRVPYRLAVKEGWAAAPTNDYQKVIWEEEMKAKEEAKKEEAKPAEEKK